VSGSSVSSAFTYDRVGNIASEVKTISSIPYTTSYIYTRNNVINYITTPDGAITKYEFGSSGEVNKVKRKEPGTSFTQVISNVDYGPHSLPTNITYTNGIVSIRTYDSDHAYRLTNILSQKGPYKHQDISYTYDNVGNILTIADNSSTNTAKTITFTYDDLNRLVSATSSDAVAGSNFSETYTYNSLGNILSKTGIGSYSYDGDTGTLYANPHAPTTIGGVSMTYDINGNLTSDSTNTYSWNYKNQIESATTTSDTLNYLYDQSGSRASMTSISGTIITPNMYYEKEGSTQRRHIYLGDNLISTIETISGTTVIW